MSKDETRARIEFLHDRRDGLLAESKACLLAAKHDSRAYMKKYKRDKSRNYQREARALGRQIAALTILLKTTR